MALNSGFFKAYTSQANMALSNPETSTKQTTSKTQSNDYDTALTQLQFNALPTEVIKRTQDETAMKDDPAYAMLQASIDKLMRLQQQRQQNNEVATAS
jgi:hypothetical protein